MVISQVVGYAWAQFVLGILISAVYSMLIPLAARIHDLASSAMFITAVLFCGVVLNSGRREWKRTGLGTPFVAYVTDPAGPVAWGAFVGFVVCFVVALFLVR